MKANNARNYRDLAGAGGMNARLIGVVNLPGVITLGGLCLGLCCCFCAIRGDIELALVCLMYAGLADLFDGVVARRLPLSEMERSYGMQLDSLADIVSFGVAPAILAVCAGFLTTVGWAVAVAYVFAVITRLAHFNITGTSEREGRQYYEGLPVTYIALFVPVSFLIRPSVEPATFSILLGALLLLVGTLCVLRVSIPKPRGATYIVLPAAALVLTWHYLS